jgi:glycosyltransferase involved in cell wall biosynthesis
MKVFIDDRGRYKQNSGYGNLSRNFAKALNLTDCEVVYDKLGALAWAKTLTEHKIQRFESNVTYGNAAECDIALTISPPVKRSYNNIPNVLYTQNALGGLKKSWGEMCSDYNAVLVPGKFDRKYFLPWNENTFICPQIIDSEIFRNRPEWREEGSDKFTYIFIGSFSYRKGCDLLLESFCRFSKIDANSSKLIMMCPKATNINYLLSKVREINPYADIEFHVKDFSQEWICRFINRADVFVTLSRGEGWCMPVFESILAEKPIILPNSTAMGESTPESSIIKIPTIEKLVKNVNDGFGEGFKAQYAEEMTVSYDVVIRDVIKSFAEIKENYETYKQHATASRQFVLSNYSHQKVGDILFDALNTVVSGSK